MPSSPTPTWAPELLARAYYSDDSVVLIHGDCRDVLATLPDASVDAVVTDPPYELGFMGKGWDTSGIAYDVGMWRECLRVLKPGGHLLAFGGSRTWHRLAAAVEDAGFEIRDSIAWLYGSGFPKSLDVSKAIDKALGAEREVTGRRVNGIGGNSTLTDDNWKGVGVPTFEARDEPATDAAREWDGWGTALKPSFEPIVVGRKPLVGTVAANVLSYGTGALNIGACRVGDVLLPESAPRGVSQIGTFDGSSGNTNPERVGRWPANVVLDESQAAELDRQSGTTTSTQHTGPRPGKASGILGVFSGQESVTMGHDDAGGASRFFPTFRYEAKAPAEERPRVDGVSHPTVKPVALMQWLVRLVTPRGGVVLEPFAGSGTTAEACVAEGLKCVAIEREESYLPLIVQRLTKPIEMTLDLGGVQ